MVAACIVIMWLKCFVSKCAIQVAMYSFAPLTWLTWLMASRHLPARAEMDLQTFQYIRYLDDTFRDKAFCHMITIQAATILALCSVKLKWLHVKLTLHSLIYTKTLKCVSGACWAGSLIGESQYFWHPHTKSRDLWFTFYGIIAISLNLSIARATLLRYAGCVKFNWYANPSICSRWKIK